MTNSVTKIKYATHLDQIQPFNSVPHPELKEVTEQFPFRSNDYYLSLIDWEDPEDPIRRLIIPDQQEMRKWGRLDPSDEKTYTIMEGLEHKYNSTALLLVCSVCEGICRYCFRKRLFVTAKREHLRDIPAAIDYIEKHTEITNVLMTGGDPLVLSTSKLDNIIGRLREIDHIQIIRIGTKMPAFNPFRIINDPELLETIRAYSTREKRIYVMSHFVHPRELTEPAVESIDLLLKAGAIVTNQAPLIRGINDKPEMLAELLAKLSFVGAAPYYIFQCRPSIGNLTYTIPIEEAYSIFEQAKAKVSGLAKRVRFVMSHSTGKIEVVGMTRDRIYFKYHRAADDSDSGRFLVFKRNPRAYWLEDYDEIVKNYPVNMPYGTYGPE